MNEFNSFLPVLSLEELPVFHKRNQRHKMQHLFPRAIPKQPSAAVTTQRPHAYLQKYQPTPLLIHRHLDRTLRN